MVLLVTKYRYWLSAATVYSSSRGTLVKFCSSLDQATSTWPNSLASLMAFFDQVPVFR